jgi:hypothetical protein
MHLLWGMMNNL